MYEKNDDPTNSKQRIFGIRHWDVLKNLNLRFWQLVPRCLQGRIIPWNRNKLDRWDGKNAIRLQLVSKTNQVHVVHLYIYICYIYIYIHVTYRYRYMICESDVFYSRLHWLPHHTARHQATNQCQSSSAESPDIDPVVAPATTSPKLSPLVA